MRPLTEKERLQKVRYKSQLSKCPNCGSNDYIDGHLASKNGKRSYFFTNEAVRSTTGPLNRPTEIGPFSIELRVCAVCGFAEPYVLWKSK